MEYRFINASYLKIVNESSLRVENWLFFGQFNKYLLTKMKKKV
jgi:hypothetical protein